MVCVDRLSRGARAGRLLPVQAALLVWVLGFSLHLPSLASESAQLAPSEALRCLTPSADVRAPVYPPEAFARKLEGLIAVRMRFAHREKPPEVTVLERSSGWEGLREAVLSKLQSYRVPCLAEGQSVSIEQEFRFSAHDGREVVQWTQPRDESSAARSALLKCWTRGPQATYPFSALRRGQQGVVPLRLRFSTPNAPPTITVLDNTPDRTLVDAAQHSAERSRLPCHQGDAVEFDVFYSFLIEGDERLVLKDMNLVDYLRFAKGIDQAQVYFNFNEMKCPFDLRVELKQPATDNAFGELDGPVPQRQFFLGWLSRQRLNMSPEQQNRLMGQQALVRVPCGALALGTNSGGAGSR